MKRIIAVALILLVPTAFAGLLVTEVSGKAEIEGKGRVATLAEIPDGARVRVLAGARLVTVDLRSGREFVLKGGAVYIVADDGPKGTDGKSVEAQSLPVKNLPYARDARIVTGAVAQAGLVMRGMPKANVPMPVSPVGTTVITQTPVFRWNAVEAANRYRLQLTTLAGMKIWEVSTQETEMALPIEHKLLPGERYVWRVEAIGEAGTLSDASARFSVAEAETLTRLAQLKPGTEAAFGRRVLYAVQLREAGAVAEAKELWKALSREHPEDAVLRLLAE